MSAGETFEQRKARTLGADWKPGDPIPLHVEPQPEQPDPVATEALQIEATAAAMRIRNAARRLVEAEEHAAAWVPPTGLPSLADELALPEEPVRYLVDKILPAGGNAMLTAQFKAGKTTLINNLVRSLADGVPFLDTFDVASTEGRIAVFNYEVGASQYRQWMREIQVKNTDRVALLHLRGQRLPLINPHVEDWVVNWLQTNEISAWIIDPFARAYTGCGDENDNGAVGVFLDTIDVIKARAGVGEVVMPIHTGRAEHAAGAERARGATRLDDWPDARWVLTRDEENRRFVRFTGRDVEEPEQMLTFDEATRRLTLGGWDRGTLRKRELVDAIIEHVTNNPGCTQNALKGATGKDPREIKRAAEQAVRLGRIRIVDGPRDSKLHYPATGLEGLVS